MKVNRSPFVSFFISCFGSDQGEKATDTCRKKAEVIQAKVKEYTNHLLASELAFQDLVDQESRHY